MENANSCATCKRMIINADISKVYIRDTEDEYRVIDVQTWVDNDDSLNGELGY